MNTENIQQWNSGLYDNKLGFVSAFGRDVVKLLQPQAGERIVDLGCGSGDLAYEIAQSKAEVIGIDSSEQMLAQAREKYPQLQFIAAGAENYTLEQPVDAVFSNAALHWVREAEAAAESVWRSLRPGGRFVAEFGGKGNVAAVIASISEVLRESFGVDAAPLNPWYFPSIGEYSSLLEQVGFRVAYAVHFERPTKMKDGEQGLKHWLDGFASVFFQGLTDEQRQQACGQIAERARTRLFRDGNWFVDYKRLRIVAVKPGQL